MTWTGRISAVASAGGRGGAARVREPGKRADLAVVGVEAVDLEVFGRGIHLVADVDRHVGLQFDLRDLLPLAVISGARRRRG